MQRDGRQCGGDDGCLGGGVGGAPTRRALQSSPPRVSCTRRSARRHSQPSVVRCCMHSRSCGRGWNVSGSSSEQGGWPICLFRGGEVTSCRPASPALRSAAGSSVIVSVKHTHTHNATKCVAWCSATVTAAAAVVGARTHFSPELLAEPVGAGQVERAEVCEERLQSAVELVKLAGWLVGLVAWLLSRGWSVDHLVAWVREAGLPGRERCSPGLSC